MNPLLRNLNVITSMKAWNLFCKQVMTLPQADPESVFRFILREAILSFPDAVYESNVEILRTRRHEPMDAWESEVGLAGDRVTFETIPFHDRLIFDLKGFPESTQEILRTPVQVAYPECMWKPIKWLPFTTQLVFDGQQVADLRGLKS